MADDFQADDAPRDLLGDPIDQARETWGRPAFQKTEQNQETVTVLKAAGWTNERIARHIGCDVKTLRKHFSLELSQATDRTEAEALLTIHRRMKEGNVSAAQKIINLAERGKAAPPQPRADQEDTPEDGAAAPQGKKERLAEAAKRPLGDWGFLN